ncbi:restriction endonuclease [Kitasatospora purpeofusca]|uniref:restriction endonuclease n=1 Tax=Kitasatospora purpeofusca TaxID=67352 RepID=UPI00225AD57B|nr:restriction endonuclease [Kitasatospora purpeofusca]MCX4690052.1 restriction endonuclease [Kitasatospora purpeofusca]
MAPASGQDINLTEYDRDLDGLLPPGPWDDLGAEFARLHSSTNAHGRGTDLERLLDRLLRRAHFTVKHNPPTADRQIDLMISSRDGTFLIEAKWEATPADVGVADNLRVRVKEVGRQTIGVLVTVGGITGPCAERIVRYREEALVLVLDEADIRVLLEDPHELAGTLAYKRTQLEMFGHVHLGTDGTHRSRRERPQGQVLPDSTRLIVDTDGKPMPVIDAPGSITPGVFTLDLPDLDWNYPSGFGVSLDVPLGSRSEEELQDALHRLNELGWLSRHAHWTIQKADRVWHGIGTRSLATTLPQWRDRLADGPTERYAESVALFDKIEDGWFCVTAELSCDDSRHTLRAHLEFQLPGVPVDQGPLHQLVQQFGVPLRGFYRPLSRKSVVRGSSNLPRPVLEVVGLITEEGGDGTWVVGVIAKNPFFEALPEAAPDGWPWELATSGVLVCALRSQHRADEPKRQYELWSWEYTAAAESTAIKITAEW